MRTSRHRSLLSWLVGFAVVAGASSATAIRPADDGIPWQLEQDLAAALQAKADALWKEKNEEGQTFQRGSFSKRFHKVDDGTYQALFVKDVAGSDRLTTERYRVTLKGSGAKWEVTDEVLEGTYQKLVREVPGDETFHRFDSFSFEKEGLKLSTGPGSLIIDYLLGQPSQFLLTGENLKYEYTPPADLPGQQGQVWAYLKKENPDAFAFGAEGVAIGCDAVTCKELLEAMFRGRRDATRDELDHVLLQFFDQQLKDQREARKEQPFRGFNLPDEPDQRHYRAGLKKQGKDQWISLGYDNRAPWEVNLWVSDFGRILGYPAAETRKAGVDPYELEQREDFLAQRYEVVSLKGEVDLALEDPELLRADIAFTIRMNEEAQEIPFFLGTFEEVGNRDKQAAITVNSLLDGNGEPLVYVRFGATGGLVVLPRPVPAGSEVIVRMDYETTGSIYKLTPTYSYVNRDSWLPFVRYEDKISDFELAVTAPAKFNTLSVGGKVSEKRAGDRLTTVWKARDVHFPTVIFGAYFEDQPTTVAKKTDGTDIPVTIYVDRDSMTGWGIPPKNLRPLASQAVNALNIYRELFGRDYPHPKLDLVNDTECLAAQSPDSIVYVGGCVFRSPSLFAEASTNATYISKFMNSVIAHEVAHQWWGGIVGNRNDRNYWFIEALAEYSSALYIEIVESEGYQKPEKGRKAYLDKVASWREEILQTDIMNSVQNSLAGYLGESTGNARHALHYAKGPYAFHILRTTFGDEKFFAFLKNLMTELGGRNVVTRDIQRVAEQSFGGNMEWFFDQWIRGVGIPEYSFNYTMRPAENGGYIVDGKVRQRVVAGLKKTPLEGVYYRGIIPLSVVGKDKQEYRKGLLVEGPETPFALKVPSQPVEITLNKNGEILAQPILDNRSW